MRYIGPFFRMNSLSEKEINGQLFYLSKEAVKTIVLNSKCGLVSQIKKYNKLSSSIDITTNSNFSPLLCVYRKASPTFIHSKNSNGFDEETFKKEINPSTNALMSLCLLELLDYYRGFENIDKSIYSINEIYKNLVKDQLDFYSIHLRNREGVFVDKKNILESNSKNFNLVDKDKKFKFSDQSFMMIAYYLYSIKNPNDESSDLYKEFSEQILKMFCDFKDQIYDCSLDEICKVLLALNILYSYNYNNDELKDLIIDLADYAMCKFDEKDYYIDSLDTASLCSIVLTLSYKHTKILTFSEKTTEIINRLYTLYDEDKGAFYKLSSKKEIKYSCFDITFYILAFIIYQSIISNSNEYRIMISTIYKKFIINSGLITSWPEAPTLDDYERYRGFSLNSNDMVDESYFRMPNIPTPDSTGIAPIFNKYITYNKRKDSFSISKNTFDSYRNFLNFFLLIHLFKDEYMDELGLLEDNILSTTEVRKSQEESINTDVVSSDVTTETEKIIETQVNTSTEVIDTVPVDIIVDENPVEIQPTSLNKSNENNEQTTKI
ncbi:hypothetical protein [uncultured Clostridium sp.]|uniref:hypothetical protein n=1 Tax=uncultured Clostridium sp. TaxID=59620 RepID=UPI0025D17482|nr:hypothetical protein [uncultured Clostridium sp.]MDU4883992.1 hypothetical protein [Clostridium celatum]MDU7077235.1 hypothetical protein [Clostridium celatum]